MQLTSLIKIDMNDVKNDSSAVRNIYPEEQDKLDRTAEIELELTLKITDLLDLYGYYMVAELEDGMPIISLRKLS